MQIADRSLQLKNWSTGVVVAARKSGCPVVPVAIGGLRHDWKPETVLFSAIEATGPQPLSASMFVSANRYLPRVTHRWIWIGWGGAVAALMQAIPDEQDEAAAAPAIQDSTDTSI